MKVAVCVHRVLDPEARLKLAEGGVLDTQGVPRILDTVDAATLEAAVQVAEASGGEVTAFTIGDGEDAEEALRTALAQGAAHAVRITGLDPADGAEAGRALAAAIAQAGPFDLTFCGARSSDHDGGSTGAVIAARLGVPVVQEVIAFDGAEDGAATVQRRRDGGYREVVRVRLPAVLTANRLVAQPRFPTTQARLRARREPIEALDAATLGLDAVAAGVRHVGFRSPAPRLRGILWPDAQLDARERLRFLVQGGAQRSGTSSRTVSGSAQEVASALADFFRERQLVSNQ